MRFRFRLHLIALFLFLISTLFAQSRKSGQYVVMLSMDAFRYDYPEIYKTKELLKIAKTGVRAKSIISSFPTVTFPNHYAMATGLYPDHHGIVLNNFFAPDLGLGYKVGDRKSVENGLFYDGEPIWTTAQKQGLITASYFWVGSETKIKGYQPNYWKLYD
ncbi:MAG TPA: ectonucleotide pyrophosphatase/phosphodiesterase, partial [Bacteroidales bacterium]|nr:ectonucleotide pyrophosphatase/phosphodiesterase [Bacteroidales bacterium]